MADSPLLVKSKAFALEIIRVCNEIKRNQKESVLTNQLVRSGTSIGANIRESFYAHSKADFIAKLQIALKECSESEIGWNCSLRMAIIAINPSSTGVLKLRKSWFHLSTRRRRTRRNEAYE